MDDKKDDNGVVNSREEDISDYIDYLKSRGKSVSTISRNVSSLKAFFRFMVTNEYISKNPVYKVKLDKVPKRLPIVLSAQHIEALLAAPDESLPKGCRDQAMLAVL
jgi:integrase/recombinase XerD